MEIFFDLLFLYNSISNRNEYQGCLLGGKASRNVGLTNLVHSFADYLETLNSWSPVQACNGIELALTPTKREVNFTISQKFT